MAQKSSDPVDSFLEACQNLYDSLMEDGFYSAKSLEEIRKSHDEKKKIVQDMSLEKWKQQFGTVPFPQATKTKLDENIEFAFNQLRKLFEASLRRKKYDSGASAAHETAVKFYRDEMTKFIETTDHLTITNVHDKHKKLGISALAQARKEAGVAFRTDLMGKLQDELDELCKMFKEKAELVMAARENPAIGIDLGTTMCCVMVFYNGKMEVVPNRAQNSSRLTPSYVGFQEDGSDTFGHDAKEDAYQNPETTIFDAKRMIGRGWNDEMLQKDMKLWPFEMVNSQGNPKIRTHNRLRFPHEISARLLARFRIMAEEHLNLPIGAIRKAVVTVPAYFTEPQRRATYEAAKCAGLEVLNILSEPTAAAIAYHWERREKGSKTALIYDLGGGTFDVAIAKVDANNIEILGVDGDTHLGGHDFDSLIMDYCIDEFRKEKGIDLLSYRNSNSTKTQRDVGRRALTRLKMKCEKAKEKLSGTEKAKIQVDSIQAGVDLVVSITRSKMEQLIRPKIRETLDIVDKALLEAREKGIDGKKDIHDIILVGGSTRMPIVKEMVSQYFDGRTLIQYINPDEAVAFGAAVQAAIFNKNKNMMKQVTVDDVTPMSLGVEIIGNIFSAIIQKNTKIPCTESKTFVTVKDDQTSITETVFQGESTKVEENKWLGEFVIDGLLPKPKGEEKVKVTMTIDEKGILEVKAASVSTGKTNSITITADRLGMDEGTMREVARECEAIVKKERY